MGDLAIVTTASDTDVRDQRDLPGVDLFNLKSDPSPQLDVILKNAMWLFMHGYSVEPNRECVIDPSGNGGFGIDQLADEGLTPATR